MKTQNRKGSTLIMTLIVFVVLMIFGTFILGFMVNENKMSLNHQHKTEAYYIARAGAVAVEEAITKELSNQFIDMGNNTIEKIKLEYITKESKKEEVPVNVEINKKDKIIEIKSTGSAKGIEETVIRVLKIKDGKSVSIDKNFIVLSERDDKSNNIPIYIKENQNIITGASKETYKPYNFSKIEENWANSSVSLPSNNVFGEDGVTTNYIVDNDLNMVNKNIQIKGKVNIFFKGKVTLNNVSSTNENKDNLNIYILGDKDNRFTSLSYVIKDTHKKEEQKIFKSNIYIESGKAEIEIHQGRFDSNIISNGSEVYIHTQTGNSYHQTINGNIYAPKATVQMNLNALDLDGFVVSNYLKLHHQNGKKFPDEGKLNLKDGINQELEKDGKSEIKSGHFK